MAQKFIKYSHVIEVQCSIYIFNYFLLALLQHISTWNSYRIIFDAVLLLILYVYSLACSVVEIGKKKLTLAGKEHYTIQYE